MSKLKVQIMSDVHIEFGNLHVPESDDDKNTVLVLAGDVGIAKKAYTYTDFVTEMSDRFRAVIYIMGNHEFYSGSIVTGLAKIWNNLLELSNVHVVENETLVIDNVAFICATLWTDFNKGDPLCIQAAADSFTGMNDYKIIRTGPSIADAYQRRFHPEDAIIIHNKSKEFIFNEVVEQKAAGREVVVVTHMSPSWQSVHEIFKTGPYAHLNGAYVSDLEDEIIETKPDLWIHGHTHTSFDYMIGDTRVICNPRGYYPHEVNPDFDPQFIVEV